MERELKSREICGRTVYYRPGINESSSDEDALAEVLERMAYRRVRDKFDVGVRERWLDLGANIGSFAVYCAIRGATATCFEPDTDCFEILKKNAPPEDFALINSAVTASFDKTLKFYSSPNPDNFYRGTVVPVKRYENNVTEVSNIWAGNLLGNPDWLHGPFDGIKMDIEGAEGPILDQWLLPPCRKLVMEYHTSRDSSVENLKRRLAAIRERFQCVRYPAAYDQAIMEGVEHYQPRFDALIFAWNPE